MNKTKITAILLAICALVGCMTVTFVNAASNEGMTFVNDELYTTSSPISKLPSTYEATVKFPKGTSASTRGGVIAGDFTNMSTVCFSFEIHQNGSPRLYFIDSSKTAHSFIFSNVNVYTGEWVHIAIVKDSSAKTITCYVDGVAAQTISQASPSSLTLTSKACIGGDHRPENEQYFKGSIKNVGFYTDIRTADEIKKDASGSYDKDNLLGFYELTAGEKKITSASGSGPEFKSNNHWVEKEAAKDYAYSFAVVGDTQILNQYYQNQLVGLYSWIESNVESKKIEYVIGLGDITDKDQVSEWTLAKNMLKKLNGKVNYSVVRGNHDTVEKFNKYFPYSEYGSTVSGSFDGTMLNTYHKFTVGDIKYMLVNLDMGPSDAVLDWANKIISENPDHNVIIATHVYLYHDGTTLDANDNAPASKCGGINDGDDLWSKLVKKHKNIVLVLSGHDPCDQIITTQTKGENGNVVTQMLIDPQTTDRNYGGLGLVAMLYFSEDGSQVEVEYISTAKNAYFMEENQFTVELAVVEASAAPIETQPAQTEAQTSPSEEETAPVETNEETTNDQTDKQEEASFPTATIAIIVAIAAVVTVVIIFLLKSKKKTK